VGDTERIESFQLFELTPPVTASSRHASVKVGLEFENQALSEGYQFIAGVDEVGRGCLAGCVVAAAVILDFSKPVPAGLNDSKKLSVKKREGLDSEIKANALSYAIAEVSAKEIDQINILEATRKAMCLAIKKLDPAADFLLIDAVQLKTLFIPQKAIIHGDAISASIAAASIIAKNYRDNLMQEIDKLYPEYGFAKHVGYGTKAHFEAIRTHGPCEIHRRSFRGVLS
jgi:ribonuclease HII